MKILGKLSATLVVGALISGCVGAAAGWKAYPTLHHTGPQHATIRERAILSQAELAHFDTVLLGDSIVELSYLPALCGKTTLNAGVGGAVLTDMVRLAPAVLAEAKPHKVIIAVGVNDTAPDVMTPSSRFRSEYARLIKSIRAQGVEVSAATIAPVAKEGSLGASYFSTARIAELNGVIRSLGVPVVDLSAVGDRSGFAPASAVTDGVHLSPAGYRPWTQAMETTCAQRSS